MAKSKKDDHPGKYTHPALDPYDQGHSEDRGSPEEAIAINHTAACHVGNPYSGGDHAPAKSGRAGAPGPKLKGPKGYNTTDEGGD